MSVRVSMSFLLAKGASSLRREGDERLESGSACEYLSSALSGPGPTGTLVPWQEMGLLMERRDQD